MVVVLPKYRFTVTDYHRMVDAGILDEDARVELLDGEVVPKDPVKPPHAAAVDRATRFFFGHCGDDVHIRIQGPARLDEYSEPEPDIQLLRHREDFYAEAHPRPGDVLLAIEVSDTSLRKDRKIKLPLYARSGVPEVWIWNLKARRLEVSRGVQPDGYADLLVLGLDDKIAPVLLPDLEITARELFGA